MTEIKSGMSGLHPQVDLEDAQPIDRYAPGVYVLFVVMVVAGVIAAWPAWADILHIVRRDDEASHILLVPPVFLWMAWTYRARLRGYVIRGSWVGALMVALGWVMSVSGLLHSYTVLWHGGAVVMMVGCGVAVVGAEVLCRLWQTLIVLVFLLPVPGAIRLPIALEMQNISAKITGEVLWMLGQSVDRAGNILVINGIDVGIAEACNGMRMVSMLFLVCYVFVFVHPLKAWVRVVLLVFSPVLAVLCNIMRLVPTVMIYGNTSLETAGQVHDLLGWVMIGVAYILLLGMVALLRWLMLPVIAAEEDRSTDPEDRREIKI